MGKSAINQSIAETRVICTVSLFTDNPYDEADLMSQLKAKGFIDPTLETNTEGNITNIEVTSQVENEFDSLELNGYSIEGEPLFEYEEWDEADMRGDWG